MGAPFEGDKKPFLFLHTEFNNYDGQFSPDGRRSPRSLTNPAARRSTSGRFAGVRSGSARNGRQVADIHRWRQPAAVARDGKELYYLLPT